jgi:hypothetical protein
MRIYILSSIYWDGEDTFTRIIDVDTNDIKINEIFSRPNQSKSDWLEIEVWETGYLNSQLIERRSNNNQKHVN